MKYLVLFITVFFFGYSSKSLESIESHDSKQNRISTPFENSDSLITNPIALNIPSVSKSLLIDGTLEDEFWKSVPVLALTNPENIYSGEGGEVRVGIRGNYLCLSAKIPHDNHLVARSTGINPTWEREDMIAWRLKYESPKTRNNVFAILAINPLGAVSLFTGATHYHGSIGDDVINSRKRLISINGTPSPPNDDFVNSVGAPLPWVNDILSATNIGKNNWTVELALPLEQFGPIGFMSIERVKAPRPEIPELSWYWPGENERGFYELSPGNQEPRPLQKPSLLPQNQENLKSEEPKSTLGKEVAAVPKHVWTIDEKKTSGINSMLEKSLRSRMAAFAEVEKQDWQKVGTLEDWEQFRDKRLNSLREWIGPFPERTPLRSTVTRRIDLGDGFIIENLIFESRPHLLVTANLYLPEKVSEKIPAIVVVHSHHAPKNQIELQDLGMTWARSGTAVLIMDQINGGERSQSQPWSRESYYGRYATGNQLYLAGESLIKWMAWDIMRGIDVLLERSFIDPDRIVLLGAVAGGGDPAALTANLDHRIAAVIPFCFGEASPEAHYLEGPRKYDFDTADPGWGFWETTRNLPHSVNKQFFPWFLCAAGAPRPFIFSFELAWPTTVEEEPAWARYKKVYEFYNAGKHLSSVDGLGPFPGPGETNQIGTYHRQRIDPILNRWFNIPIPQSEYHNMRAESELWCLTPAVAAKYKPEPVSSLVRNLAIERLSDARSKRTNLTAAERKKALSEALKEKLGNIEPVSRPSVHTLWTRKHSNFIMEASSVETEKGITLPVFLFIPENKVQQYPVVLALAQGGKEGFLNKRYDEIASLLEKGIAVCLPDLRATGELNSSTSRGPGAMSHAANELMLGGTLIGSQLKDARTIFHWLSRRSDIDSKRIVLWGDSFAEPNAPDFIFDQSPGQKPGPVPQRQSEPLGSFLTVLTALYESQVSAIACSGGLVSFLSVLENRYCHIPQDVVVPGILEVTDLGEIVESIFPRPVFLEKMVDGRNKKVTPEIMKKEYGANSSLFLHEDSDDHSLADWISTQCLMK